MKDYLQFMIMLEGVAICAEYFNAATLLRIDVSKRYLIFAILQGLNWAVFIVTFFLISSITIYAEESLVYCCCIVAKILSAVGNCTNYG